MCKDLRELRIGGSDVLNEIPRHALKCLGTALGAGCMPVLQRLNITMDFERGGFEALMGGLCKGASPHLFALKIPLSVSTEEISNSDRERNSKIYRVFMKEGDRSVKILASVLAARKRLGCDGLKKLPDRWILHGSVNARMRIVRSTLATLDTLSLNYAVGGEFCAQLPTIFESQKVLVPQMRRVYFCQAFRDVDIATQHFDAMGRAMAFKNVRELHISQPRLKTDAFQALSSTLKMDALPVLELFSLYDTPCQASDLGALLESLVQSACAHSLRRLRLFSCNIRAEGVEVLGLLIGRNSLPSLNEVDIHRNSDIGIKGVMALMQGLRASSHTKLANLGLENVGLNDEGIKTLMDLIESGAFGDAKVHYTDGRFPFWNNDSSDSSDDD